MIKYLVVTSFRVGCKMGERFMSTFDQFRNEETCILPVTDGAKSMHARLEDDPDWVYWSGRTPLEARRFGHKIFAYTRQGLHAQWVIWMDSDVIFNGPIDFSFLDDEKSVAYLGRPWWKWSECGFVGFNMRIPETNLILNGIKDAYMKHDPMTLEWGYDCTTFDNMRRKHVPERLWQDLTGHLPPRNVEQRGTHVWPQSPLHDFSVHYKGPKRKRAAYGV